MVGVKYVAKKYISWSLLIYVVFIATMVAVLSYKTNYHIDEIFTYGNANYQNSPFYGIEDGREYTPGDKLFVDYVTVEPQHRFAYSNVWHNLSRDTHPPLYLAIVHTICSFFPGRFSLWFAGCVNIAFAVLTLYVLKRLSYYYVNDNKLVYLISTAFAFSGGILSGIAFLRMYVMAMFWVVLLTYIFVRKIRESISEKDFLLQVFLATLLSALTHYYCIVYAVLISVVYGLFLLFENRNTDFVHFFCSMSVAGLISVLFFPAMVRHILGGRGSEAIHNAIDFSDFFHRIKTYSLCINEQLFGNLGAVLFVLLIVLCIIFVGKNCLTNRKESGSCFLRKQDSQNLKKYKFFWMDNDLLTCYTLLVVPTVFYFLIVSKITVLWPDSYDRYMFPIYGNIVLLMCLLCIHFFKEISEFNHARVFAKSNICLVFITLCAITVKSWFSVGWPYLYQDSKPFLEEVSKHKGIENICFYKNVWCTCAMFMEAGSYSKIQFCKYNNEKVKKQLMSRIEASDFNTLMVTLVQPEKGQQEACINEILKRSGTLKYSKKLGSVFYGNSTSYLLSRNNIE